jgi:hypothetical protein
MKVVIQAARKGGKPPVEELTVVLMVDGWAGFRKQCGPLRVLTYLTTSQYPLGGSSERGRMISPLAEQSRVRWSCAITALSLELWSKCLVFLMAQEKRVVGDAHWEATK